MLSWVLALHVECLGPMTMYRLIAQNAAVTVWNDLARYVTVNAVSSGNEISLW